MSLRLYNSATRKKEVFCPIREGQVGIYVCGVTVYDLCHIGHARSAIVFDVLVRYVRGRGYTVTYVRNFTDVDDKIIERARQTREDTASLAEKYIHAFYEDMHALGVLDADIEPRATEHIDDMIDMVSRLLDKGHAYDVDGDVYFSVDTFDQYGQLSGRNLEDMIAGARIAVDEKKRNPLDFILWKSAKPGEPKWKSPWGEGRPGWHMECSVMSSKYLGANFDIHGGGRDLIFPHHENERAQAMAANGANFANYWVHNGFLTVESEKMSKSVGNFITIRDALRSYHPQELRLFLLSKHYRSPLDFSRAGLSEAKSGLVRIYRTLQRLDEMLGHRELPNEETARSLLADDEKSDFKARFMERMDDDLNTAGALGLVFDKVREINRLIDSPSSKDDMRSQLLRDRSDILDCGKTMGLFELPVDTFFSEIARPTSEISTPEIESMIDERNEARKNKDWVTADRIREELLQRDIVLEDGSEGTTWRTRIERLE
jgi:cysteinyl-tRNA synthetase